MTVTDFSAPRPDLWSLAPGILHLNHGSYGAVPRRTQEVLAALRAETETNPMLWFRSVADRLTASRLELAAFLGLAEVEVEKRGDLAKSLAAAVR